MMLAGDTSRWTICSGCPFLPRRSWAWCRPAAAPLMIITASSSGIVQPRRMVGSRIARVVAVHVLHRHEVGAVGLVDLVDLSDVLMVQRGRELGLVQEHRDKPLILRALPQDG